MVFIFTLRRWLGISWDHIYLPNRNTSQLTMSNFSQACVSLPVNSISFLEFANYWLELSHVMAILSWKWACVINGLSIAHIFSWEMPLTSSITTSLSSFLCSSEESISKDEMYQWDRDIVPQYHIWVQIFMSRIQAFPLWREVCSQVPQNHQPLGLGFHFAVPYLYFSEFFSWNMYRPLCLL